MENLIWEIFVGENFYLKQGCGCELLIVCAFLINNFYIVDMTNITLEILRIPPFQIQILFTVTKIRPVF